MMISLKFCLTNQLENSKHIGELHVKITELLYCSTKNYSFDLFTWYVDLTGLFTIPNLFIKASKGLKHGK